MQGTGRHVIVGLVTVFCLVFFSACSESDHAQCGSSIDCAGNEVCRAGQCELVPQAECADNTQCAPGYKCFEASCIPDDTNTTPDPDPTNNQQQPTNNTQNPTNNQQQPDTNNTTNPDTNNPPLDPGNPRVTSSEPAANATGVALNATIRVTFSKPMDERTLHHHSFYVLDPDNQKVAASPPSYDASSHTASLQLNSPLLPATQYRIVVNQNARDIANNTLYEQYEFTFYTTYKEPNLHSTLAELYAPVIYQGVRRYDSDIGARSDIPTRLDFDGDMEAKNNRTNSQNAHIDLKSYVYYNVTESKTHYLIQYVLYYATRLVGNHLHEHDMTGIVVIVDKDTMEVVLVEGIESTNSDNLMAFKPSNGVVEGTNATARNNLSTFPTDALEDGSRYPLYVPGGEHAACNWYTPTDTWLPRCRHDAQKFPGGDDRGVVLRLGTAQKFEDAQLNEETGLKEMTYELLPFAKSFWMYRADYSCGLFELPFQYRPDGDRPKGPIANQSLYLPGRICSEPATSGPDSEVSFAIPPFRWVQTPASNNAGQWFLDPLYMLSWRYNFGDDVEFSTDYCVNLFFNINRINDPAHPECVE